jgi:hypothetical protein
VGARRSPIIILCLHFLVKSTICLALLFSTTFAWRLLRRPCHLEVHHFSIRAHNLHDLAVPLLLHDFQGLPHAVEDPGQDDGDDPVLFLVAKVLGDYERMLGDRGVDINCRNPPVRQRYGNVQEDGPLEAILCDQVRQRDSV